MNKYLVCLMMIVICCLSEKPTVLAKNQYLYDDFQSIWDKTNLTLLSVS